MLAPGGGLAPRGARVRWPGGASTPRCLTKLLVQGSESEGLDDDPRPDTCPVKHWVEWQRTWRSSELQQAASEELSAQRDATLDISELCTTCMWGVRSVWGRGVSDAICYLCCELMPPAGGLIGLVSPAACVLCASRYVTLGSWVLGFCARESHM